MKIATNIISLPVALNVLRKGKIVGSNNLILFSLTDSNPPVAKSMKTKVIKNNPEFDLTNNRAVFRIVTESKE